MLRATCTENKGICLNAGIPSCRCGTHLHSRADRCEGIHLGEADRLAVHSLRLLDHDGGAGLALRPGGRRSVCWFGLIKDHVEGDRHRK